MYTYLISLPVCLSLHLFVSPFLFLFLPSLFLPSPFSLCPFLLYSPLLISLLSPFTSSPTPLLPSFLEFFSFWSFHLPPPPHSPLFYNPFSQAFTSFLPLSSLPSSSSSLFYTRPQIFIFIPPLSLLSSLFLLPNFKLLLLPFSLFLIFPFRTSFFLPSSLTYDFHLIHFVFWPIPLLQERPFSWVWDTLLLFCFFLEVKLKTCESMRREILIKSGRRNTNKPE